MQFKKVIGQAHLKSKLCAHVQQGRISHAQLFLGEEGYGSLALALAYACYIMCENKQEDDSCGQCASCQKHAKGIHPDVYYTFPFIAGSKSNTCADFLPEWRSAIAQNAYFNLEMWIGNLGESGKQAQINKEEGTQIIYRNTLKAYEGGYKVNIIWRPELMHHTVSNGILKLLEEPPPQTLFLLVSGSADDILPTILSRTQVLRILRPEPHDLIPVLINSFGVDEKKASETVSMADCNLIECASLIDKSEAELHIFEQFRQWMRICYNRKLFEINQWIEESNKLGRESLKQFLQYGLFVFEQSVKANYLGPDYVQALGEERDFILKFSPFINENTVEVFTRNFDEAYRDISRNGNPKIVLLDLSFKTFSLLKKQTQ